MLKWMTRGVAVRTLALAIVSVLVLGLGGCGAPVDPTVGIASLAVVPGSALLTAQGDNATLTVRAFRSDGSARSLEGVALEWATTDDTAVRLGVSASDPTSASVTALTGLGSAIVTVRVKGKPGLVAPPAPVTIAPLTGGTKAVAPSRVVFPFDALPPGATPATYLPPHVKINGGSATLGAFSESEVAAAFELDSNGELRSAAVLTEAGGPTPSVGDVLVSGGGGAFMGLVTGVTARGGYLLVTLDPVAIQDVYQKLSFRYDGPALEAGGWTPSAVRTAGGTPWGGALALQAGCTWEGNFTSVNVTTPAPTLTIAFHPDVLIDTDQGIYRVLLPLKATIQMEPGFKLQAGALGKVNCKLGAPYKSLWSLPGPLAALFAVSAELQKEFEASADFSAGPQLSGKLTLKGEADIQVGFDTSTPNQDHNTVDFSMGVTPSGTADGPASDDLKFQLSAKLVEAGDLGVQLGGYVVGTGAQYLNWIPYLGEKIQKLAEALDLQILKSEVGPVGDAIWESAKRVLNQEGANTTLALNAVGVVTLESDTLNTMLAKLGHAPIKLQLFKATLPLGTLFRVFDKDRVTATTSCFSGAVTATPVCVHVGETAEFRVRVKYKGAPLLFGSDRPLEGGQLWLDKTTVLGPESSVNPATKMLTFRVPITSQMCGSTLYFVAVNSMGGIESPGYGGKAPLLCSGGSATYTMTVDPPSHGKILSDPPGIDCGSDCSEPFPVGTSVSLSAVPTAGYVFDHWTGDCSGSGSCMLTMDGARHIGVVFVLDGGGGGTVPLGVFGSPFLADGDGALMEAAQILLGGGAAPQGVSTSAVAGAIGNLSGDYLAAFAGGGGFVVVDLTTHAVVHDATGLTGGPYFGVSAVTHGGGPDAPAAFLAFGAGGWAVQGYDAATHSFATPAETVSTPVYDAFPAGGGVVSDLLPFSQPNVGVHFLAYDAASEAYATTAELLAAGGFDGELVSAFVPDDALAPGSPAPALVLTRDVISRLYLVPRDGGAVQGPMAMALDARKIRCAPPGSGSAWICVVTEFGADRIELLTWDGAGSPTYKTGVLVGDGPVDVDLAVLPNGDVAVLTTGFNDGSITEVEVDGNGNVQNTVSASVPAGCVQPGHAVYLRDAVGLKVLTTCYGNSHYVVSMSGL